MQLAKRLHCALIVCATVSAILSLAANVFTRADEPDNPVFAAVTLAPLDDLQATASQIAKKLDREDMATGVFELIRAQKFVAALDSQKPITIAFASNGDTVAPFLRAALKESPSDALPPLNETLAERLDDLECELRVQDSALYIGQKALMDFILSISEESLAIAPNPAERAPLVAFELNVTNAPKEILEAGAAALRIKLAEGVSELDDEEQIDQLDQILDYLFDVFECVETLRISLALDENCAFLATFDATFKDGSFLADELAKSQATPTRWAALTSLSNAIYGNATAGVVSERSRELAENASTELGDLIEELAQKDRLSAIVDEPENYELAKEILKLLGKAAEKDGRLEAYDSGLAFLARPVAVIVGSAEASTEELREVLERVVARLRSENAKFNEYAALDAEEIAGFSVSKITIPMSDFCSMESYRDQALAFRVALGKDAAALAFAVADKDGKEFDDLFAQVLTASNSPVTQPTEAVFDLSQLATLAQDVLESLSDKFELTDEARATLKCFSENSNAKIVFSNEYAKNALKLQMKADGSIIDSIKAVVDAVEEAKLEDSGQDVDDLFDEE